MADLGDAQPAIAEELIPEKVNGDGEPQVDKEKISENINDYPIVPYYIGKEFDLLPAAFVGLQPDISNPKVEIPDPSEVEDPNDESNIPDMPDLFIYGCTTKGHVRSWNLTQTCVSMDQKLKIEKNEIISSFYVGEKSILTGNDQGYLDTWTFAVGEKEQRCQPHSGKISNIQLFKDHVFTTGFDGAFRVVNLEYASHPGNQAKDSPDDPAAHGVVHSFSACPCPLSTLIVNDPNSVWIGSWDGKVRLLDLRQKSCKALLLSDVNVESPVRDIAFSAENNMMYIAHGIGHIGAWDVRMPEDGDSSSPSNQVLYFPGHRDVVNSVVTRENRLYSGSEDQQVRVWDCTTGSVAIDKLSGHTSGISQISLVASHLVTCSDDKTVRVYDSNAVETAITMRKRAEEERKLAAEEAQRIAAEEAKLLAASKKKGKKGKKGKKK